jgi:hypothetical protein
MRLIFALALTAALAAACASDRPLRASAFIVVEENASIPNRHLIRSTRILDNDVLLIDTRPGQLFRVDLFAPCVSIGDISRPIRVEGVGLSVTRTTRFRVGNRTCSIRSISRVERAPPQQGGAG